MAYDFVCIKDWNILFEEGKLKQSAYLLDDIEQYLAINKFLNHNSGVDFFNKKITTKGFVITP